MVTSSLTSVLFKKQHFEWFGGRLRMGRDNISIMITDQE